MNQDAAAQTRTLYLLRHGEIFTPEILAGQTDVKLSDKGWQQLEQATQGLSQLNSCISSPLQRCLSFAKYFTEKQQLSLQIDASLQEMDFGQWDGLSYQQLWQNKQSPSLGDFWQNPWQHQIPEAESLTDFVARVDRSWQQIVAQSSLGNCLVICHAGVIKHIVARLLQLPIPGMAHLNALSITYGGIVKVEIYHDQQGKHWPKLILG